MPLYDLCGQDGEIVDSVSGHRFNHYIGGIEYWFIRHLDRQGNTQVTDWVTRYKVLTVPHITVAAFLGGQRGACKKALDDLVAKVGPDRVRQVLDQKAQEVKEQIREVLDRKGREMVKAVNAQIKAREAQA